MKPDDESIRQLFAAQRRADAAEAPSFRRFVAEGALAREPEPSSFFQWLPTPVGACVLLLAAVWISLSSIHPAPSRDAAIPAAWSTVENWTAPTDDLLVAANSLTSTDLKTPTDWWMNVPPAPVSAESTPAQNL